MVVVGFGDDNGVVGYSNGIDDESAGIAGFSKKGYGAIFSSQKKYALYANGIGVKKKDIVGSGKALLAHGESDFIGQVRFVDEKGNTECMCINAKKAIESAKVINTSKLPIIFWAYSPTIWIC